MKYKKPKTDKSHFFDTWNFENIIEIAKYDPYGAIPLFEKYIDEYKEDYGVKSYYASALLTISRFEEAKHVLENLEESYENDRNYLKYKDRVEMLKANIIYAKIKYLMYTHNYKECYDLCTKYYSFMGKCGYDVDRTLFLCKKHLGMLDINRRSPNSYLYSQIVFLYLVLNLN